MLVHVHGNKDINISASSKSDVLSESSKSRMVGNMVIFNIFAVSDQRVF